MLRGSGGYDCNRIWHSKLGIVAPCNVGECEEHRGLCGDADGANIYDRGSVPDAFSARGNCSYGPTDPLSVTSPGNPCMSSKDGVVLEPEMARLRSSKYRSLSRNRQGIFAPLHASHFDSGVG
jgi:hypothetical protein